MLTQIAINRDGGDKHAEILDVAEVLANGDYASGTNALVVMVRQSPLFQATLPKVTLEENSVPADAPANPG